MSIEPGERFGAYEIGNRLGTGAMGDVFRARDLRLGREVALKVLPERFRDDSERRVRFEAEALALSALNHPNIVTVYGAETHGDIGFIAMELVEGKTLRSLLAEGPLPPKRALDIAAQAAAGLAAAHTVGIVHRDFKPENVMIGPGGLVKVVDFGIARRTLPVGEGSARDPTVRVAPHVTESGAIIGTVSYMSPEQAEGHDADFRSDQFALGSVLLEMLSGEAPFRRASAGATLAAILRDEAPPLPPLLSPVAAPVAWIVERCLAKNPAERYGSTADLARDLAHARDLAAHGSWPEGPAVSLPRTKPRRVGTLGRGFLLLMPFLLAGAAWLGARLSRPPVVEFHRLTFRRGTVGTARFATPDGSTVVYSAQWSGEESRVYRSRVDAPEATVLPFGEAALFAVSRQGKLALCLRPKPEAEGSFVGTLAEAQLEGETARPLTEGVVAADISPDGGQLAVARFANGSCRLEYLGRVLRETAGWIGPIRFSPDGKRIAFFDHPVRHDDRGVVSVVDLAGGQTVLSDEWTTLQGLDWAASGESVWFTGAESYGPRALVSVDLGGKKRRVGQFLGSITVHDVSRNGRVLLSRDERWMGIIRRAEAGRDEDLSWLDSSFLADLSTDGRTILFTEYGETSGPSNHVYVRRSDRRAPTRLDDGIAAAISPDGRWALALLPGEKRRVIALPLDVGKPIRFPPAAVEQLHWATWLPDQKSLLLAANEVGRAVRLWVQPVDGGALRPVSNEGITLGFPGIAMSPDGKRVAAMDGEGRLTLFSIGGDGTGQTIPGLDPGLFPVDFTADGRTLFAFEIQSVPARLFRIDIETGRRTLEAELAPPDRAGLLAIPAVHTSADGRVIAYTYVRILSDLYAIDGLK
jgi:serine/threonine protein kinase/Tol biopolymer transport system component